MQNWIHGPLVWHHLNIQSFSKSSPAPTPAPRRSVCRCGRLSADQPEKCLISTFSFSSHSHGRPPLKRSALTLEDLLGGEHNAVHITANARKRVAKSIPRCTRTKVNAGLTTSEAQLQVGLCSKWPVAVCTRERKKKKSSQRSPSNVCWWSSIGAGVGLRGITVPWSLKLQLSGWIFFLTKLYTTLGWSWIVRSLLRPPSLFRHRFSSIHSWNLDPQRPSAVSLSLKWRNATAAAGGARDTHAVNSSTEQRFIHAFSKLVTCKQWTRNSIRCWLHLENGRWRERRAEIPGTSQPNKGYTFL